MHVSVRPFVTTKKLMISPTTRKQRRSKALQMKLSAEFANADPVQIRSGGA